MSKNERFLAENITVSNDTKVTGLNNNDIIIGSSGSGKTGGYVISNIQNISNCDHLLYLGTQDIKTAEFIGYRAFKTPEKVLCMPNDKAILITKGEKDVEVNKIPPYSTMPPAFKQKTPPKIGEIVV